MVPADEQRRSAELLAQWLDRHKVEELFAPNLVIEALVQAAGEQDLDLATLQSVAQAGEALRLTPRVREFFTRHGRVLHNHYGPTETHVVTACTLPRW